MSPELIGAPGRKAWARMAVGILTASLLLTPLASATGDKPDLAVDKSDLQDPVFRGENITYSIVVQNIGTAEATTVLIQDTLPDGVTLLSVQPTTGCSRSPGKFECTVGPLAPGAYHNLTVIVRADTSGEKTNSVEVATRGEDNTRNNADSEKTNVLERPLLDISVKKDDVRDPVFVGDNITYVINVTNHGRSKADKVSIVDMLPAGTTLLAVTPPTGCARFAGGFTCDLGPLDAGESKEIRVTVRADTPGDKLNKVTAEAADPAVDTNPDNNTDEERTRVITRAPGLNCIAQEDESVFLDWNDVAGATGYNVYRAVGAGSFSLLATTTQSQYLDDTTQAGQLYRYQVTSLSAGGESERSEICEVTAIPLFPGLLAGALALLGSVGAVHLLRRRS